MASSAFGATGAIAALPAGVMIDYAGAVAPAGWIMCDGAAVSRTVYAGLFASIGTVYGAGDGSTTFNLPDFRGRFARYMDNMQTPAGAASRDTGRALGTAQTQDTAKNGLTNQSSSVSVSGSTSSGSNSGWNMQVTGGGDNSPQWGGHSIKRGSNLSGGTGDGSYPGQDHIHNFTASGTAAGQNITQASNAETRPINLSCNRIIKY